MIDRSPDPQWRRMHALMSKFTPLSRTDWHDVINQLLRRDPPLRSRAQLHPRDVRRVVDAIEGYLIISHVMREARRDHLGPAMEQMLAADRYRIANGEYDGIDNPETVALVAALYDLVTQFRASDITISTGRKINK